MSALVTGATGYIGANLVRYLVSIGEEVHIIHRRGSSLQSISDLPLSRHEHVRESDNLSDIIASANPSIVYHIAGAYVAEHSVDDIPALIEGNILFGTRLLNAISQSNCKSVVIAGTTWQRMSNDNSAPATLYAATKAAQEAIASYFVDAFGLSAAFVRFSDTYGPHDTRRKLFSLLRNAALKRQKLAMSPGEQWIDLIYIDDLIKALIRAGGEAQATQPPAAQTWIARPIRRYRLREIVELWREVTNYDLLVSWGERAYRAREVMQPWNGAPQVPGWEPQVTLREGIRLMEQAYAQG